MEAIHVPSLATVKVPPSALSKSPSSSSYICNRLTVFSSASSFHHGYETPHFTGITKGGSPASLAFNPDGRVLASGE
jgi:hypothetical protein